MDPLIRSGLDAYEASDADFVERAFRDVLRRPPDDEARARALGKLADGTLSRATFLHELAAAPEAARVRELDDAIALGLAARARGEPLTWLQAPTGTDERVIEIPWVLSRLVPAGRVLEVGYAFAEAPYLVALLRSGVELVGADNSGYGLAAEEAPASRADALRELGRVLRPGARLLVTVPLGEPGDHGWFRLDDVAGWNGLFASAGLFVEEQEAYELTADGWRAAPGFRAEGVGYGDHGPAASAVLCTALSVGRLRRLATPDGLSRTVKRRLRPLRHRT